MHIERTLDDWMVCATLYFIELSVELYSLNLACSIARYWNSI